MILGLITTRDVLRHAPMIVRGFGAAALLRCCLVIVCRWAVLHEVRSDWAPILTAMYLFAAGPGPVSLDAWLARRRSAARPRGSAPAVALP